MEGSKTIKEVMTSFLFSKNQKKKLTAIKNWSVTGLNRLAVEAYPYLVTLTYAFLVIEACTYIGFLRSLIFIDAISFATLTVLLGIYVVPKLPSTGMFLQKMYEYIFMFSRLITPVNLFLYFLLASLEEKHYPNYVFAHYHVNYELFRYVAFFSVSILLLDISRQYHKKVADTYRSFKERGLRLELIAVIIIALSYARAVIPTSISITRTGFLDVGFIVTHLFLSYKEKQLKALSEFSYLNFIKENTPETASIGIPPQMPPWLTTGNEGYVRYFLFPRKIVKIPDKNKIPEFAEYLLIDKGEWAVPDPNEYGWPKKMVKADKIWYFDKATNSVIESEDKIFDPNNPDQKLRWGLIKVAKE